MTGPVAGLVSVTFRALSAESVLALAVRCGLHAIEWGGDVHVPHGDLGRATMVGTLTRSRGLAVASYGSYYRFDDALGIDAADAPHFDQVLDTAVALGAPVVRIWAGRRASAACPASDRDRIVQSARQAGDRAAARGLTLAFEYHANTLTDTPASARALLSSIDHPQVRSLWQPSHRVDRAANGRALSDMLPWLVGVHLFYWGPGGFSDRLSLADGALDVAAWLAVLRSAASNDRLPVMLEFVRDDDPEQLRRDALTLTELLARDRNAR